MLLLSPLSLDYFSFFSPCPENYCRNRHPAVTSYCRMAPLAQVTNWEQNDSVAVAQKNAHFTSPPQRTGANGKQTKP